jgi:hypothetical protein
MSKSRSKQKADILDKVEAMSSKPTVINKDNIDSIDLSKVKYAPGRPVDPTSERQLRLAEREKNGTIGKRGRPADPNSPNYQKKQELEQRKAVPGYVAKRGRPADPTSDANKKKQGQLERKKEYITNLVNSGKQILLQEDDDDQMKVSDIIDVETEMKES